MRRIAYLLVLSVIISGCTTGPTTDPSPTPPPTSASAPAGSPPATTPTPEEPFIELDEIVLSEPSALGPSWSELFALPYGDAPEQLGTSLGGDGEGIQWGPSYGTQLPDGTWWFLDTAHVRLAHYSETGDYLGETPIPEQYLAGGEYVQYATPLALSDGTVVLQSTTPDDPALLLLSPQGGLSRVGLPEYVGVKGTDGTHLYGFAEDGSTVRIDPQTGALTAVDAFTGQSGQEFALSAAPGRIELTRSGTTLDLPVTATGHESATVYLSLEATDGADGVLNLLITGVIEDSPGEATDLAGFVRINATGRGLVESVRPLTSESDPADGLRLGVRLGDSQPWLMVIDPDAVRVYRRG